MMKNFEFSKHMTYLINGTLFKNHTPRLEVDIDLYRILKKSGIVHFTTTENAKKILQDGCLKPCPQKSAYLNEVNYVWFFLNNGDYANMISYINRKRKEDDVAIFIAGLSDSQIKNMRYKKKNNIMIHDGDLYFSEAKIVKISDLLNNTVQK